MAEGTKPSGSKGSTWWCSVTETGNIVFTVCRMSASWTGALQSTQAPLTDWEEGQGEEKPSYSASVVPFRHELKGVLFPGVNYYSFIDIRNYLTQLTALPKSKTFLLPVPLHIIATALQAMQWHSSLLQPQKRRDNICTFRLLRTWQEFSF